MVQVQLFESGMERVDQLNNLTRNIFSLRETLLEELKSLDTVWQSGKSHQMDRLLNIWRLLSFYERWLAQIQERTVQLSF